MKAKSLQMAVALLAAGWGGVTVAAGAEAAGGSPGLTRDGDRKWPVPAKMKVHLGNVERAVRTAQAGPRPDHGAHAATIREELRAFVSQCTMEGPAHDQLHRWLVPFLQQAERYAQAGTVAEQEATLRGMRRALEVFHEYFE